MSYEHKAHVLVLGASLVRAVDKMNELVGNQEVTATMTQKKHTYNRNGDRNYISCQNIWGIL